MLRIMARTWGLTLLVGALGALLGYGLELVLGQAGWALAIGSVGLCGGAIFAGSLATRAPLSPAPTTGGNGGSTAAPSTPAAPASAPTE
jgi:hypothetical protein